MCEWFYLCVSFVWIINDECVCVINEVFGEFFCDGFGDDELFGIDVVLFCIVEVCFYCSCCCSWYICIIENDEGI